MDAMAYDNDPCEFDLRNDHGGHGWCDSSASDGKCILDEAIATLLVTWGYHVPTTRKTVAFFLLCVSDADISDLPFKERVALVYENFGFRSDDACWECWWDPDDWDEWLLVQDELLSSLALSVQVEQPSSFALPFVPASPVPLPAPLLVPVPAPLASAPPPAAASPAAAAGFPPGPAPPASVSACAAAAPAGAAASALSPGFPAASSLAAASASAAAPSSAPSSARAAASPSASASALASAPLSPLFPPPFPLFGPLVGAEHTAFVGVRPGAEHTTCLGVRPPWVGWTPSFVPFPSSPFFPWFGWDPGWILPSLFLLPSVRRLRAFLAGVDFSNPLLRLVDGVTNLLQTRDTEDCARTTLIVLFVKYVGGLAHLPLLIAPVFIRSHPNFSPTSYLGVASRNGPRFCRDLLGALASPSCSAESYGGESCGSGAVRPRIGAELSTG